MDKCKISGKKLMRDFFRDFGGIPFMLLVFFSSAIINGLLLYWFIEFQPEIIEIISMLNSFGRFWMYVMFSMSAMLILWLMFILVIITVKWIEINYEDKQQKLKESK